VKIFTKMHLSNESYCAIRSVMTEVRTAILELSSGDVADLCERTHQLRSQDTGGLDYAI